MSEEQKQKLQKQLWDIANTLRGKMNADEFRSISSVSIQANCPARKS